MDNFLLTKILIRMKLFKSVVDKNIVSLNDLNKDLLTWKMLVSLNGKALNEKLVKDFQYQVLSQRQLFAINILNLFGFK